MLAVAAQRMLFIVSSTMLLAGCSASTPTDPNEVPGRLDVEWMKTPPPRFISWEKIPSDQRPPELPPLFEKALANRVNRWAGHTLSDHRGDAIKTVLETQWRAEHGFAPLPPRPSILYNSSYFQVSVLHSYSRAA